MVDCFSGFPFTKRLTSTTTKPVFQILLSWFNDWGLPQIIRSDNGPQFGQKFQDMCTSYNIIHETSSPYFPASNGLAESAVKSVKYLLTKCAHTKEDFSAALLAWRNVPRADGISPSQAFLGRRQRTSLPNLNPSSFYDFSSTAETRQNSRNISQRNFNEHAKSLPPLEVDQTVLLQNPHSLKWTDFGVIQSVSRQKRSYTVLVNGKLYRRNRLHIRPITSPSFSPTLPISDDTASSETDTLPRRSTRIRAQQKLDIVIPYKFICIFTISHQSVFCFYSLPLLTLVLSYLHFYIPFQHGQSTVKG